MEFNFYNNTEELDCSTAHYMRLMRSRERYCVTGCGRQIYDHPDHRGGKCENCRTDNLESQRRHRAKKRAERNQLPKQNDGE